MCVKMKTLGLLCIIFSGCMTIHLDEQDEYPLHTVYIDCISANTNEIIINKGCRARKTIKNGRCRLYITCEKLPAFNVMLDSIVQSLEKKP
jgi:hypothetical protein